MTLGRFYRKHGTKVLGYLVTAIPIVLSVEEVIPPTQKKWWILASALLGPLVVARGHENSKINGARP